MFANTFEHSEKMLSVVCCIHELTILNNCLIAVSVLNTLSPVGDL